MKLSEATLSVLKNFATINVNIVMEPGKTLRTISPSRNIFAKAAIEEELPTQIAIYDLGSFLQSITLFDNAELDFKDKFVTVTSDNGEIKYFYSDPSVVTAAPNKEIVLDKDLFKFKLAAGDISAIMRAAAALAAPSISLFTEEGKVKLSLSDRKNATSHSFVKEVGTEKEHKFDIILRVDNFKIMPANYECIISKKGEMGVVRLTSEDDKLHYWMTTEVGSKV